MFFFTSCTKQKPYVNTVFEGKWGEVVPDDIFGGDRYDFTFRSDSFYLIMHKSTDVYSNSKCHGLSWNEYYSGMFKYDKDSVYLEGIRTDSLNYKVKNTDCVKEKNFDISYKYKFRNDTLIFLPRETMRYNYDSSILNKPNFDWNRFERKVGIFLKKDVIYSAPY